MYAMFHVEHCQIASSGHTIRNILLLYTGNKHLRLHRCQQSTYQLTVLLIQLRGQVIYQIGALPAPSSDINCPWASFRPQTTSFCWPLDKVSAAR